MNYKKDRVEERDKVDVQFDIEFKQRIQII